MARQGNIESQTQAQTQVQTLSPQQVLEVRLLELPAIELEQRIRAELDDNPALEEKFPDDEDSQYTDPQDMSEESLSPDPDSSDNVNNYDEYDTPNVGDPAADFASADDIPDYYGQPHHLSDQERAAEIPVSDVTSFYDKLKQQLAEHELTELQKIIADYIIGSLDGNGFLDKSPQELADDLAIYQGLDVTPESVQEVLDTVRLFDPAGVGARDLQDCLLIQIERMEKPYDRNLAHAVISQCFDDFTHKRWERIIQRLHISEETFNMVLDDLLSLNPRPGSSLGEVQGRSIQQITPDFTVESYDGEIRFNLNNFNLPELKVSQSFTQMLNAQIVDKNSSRHDEAIYIKQKIDSARGFIQAIHQRHNTLCKTMQAIIDLQKPFFIEGDKTKLRPMILKDVAELTGLDISTISRATQDKYVETDFGIFPLKSFFTDGFTKDGGEEVSVNEIHSIIKELIDTEDSSDPLTDQQLSDVLRSKGYPVARRTIAKYREQLGIPIARMRR